MSSATAGGRGGDPTARVAGGAAAAGAEQRACQLTGNRPGEGEDASALRRAEAALAVGSGTRGHEPSDSLGTL